jgi:hypothetical protein
MPDLGRGETALSDTAASKIFKVNDVINVDEEHGLVFGFAIVCKVWNEAAKAFEDYYDLNVDTDGVHKGQPVPENIPEDSMFKAWVDASASGSHLPGNDMHAGPDVGSYYSLFPLTTDIAKTLGIETKRTGLICAYKPTPEVLAKFKDGTYTGFSIEGARIATEEVPDAA